MINLIFTRFDPNKCIGIVWIGLCIANQPSGHLFLTYSHFTSRRLTCHNNCWKICCDKQLNEDRIVGRHLSCCSTNTLQTKDGTALFHWYSNRPHLPVTPCTFTSTLFCKYGTWNHCASPTHPKHHTLLQPIAAGLINLLHRELLKRAKRMF